MAQKTHRGTSTALRLSFRRRPNCLSLGLAVVAVSWTGLPPWSAQATRALPPPRPRPSGPGEGDDGGDVDRPGIGSMEALFAVEVQSGNGGGRLTAISISCRETYEPSYSWSLRRVYKDGQGGWTSAPPTILLLSACTLSWRRSPVQISEDGAQQELQRDGRQAERRAKGYPECSRQACDSAPG